LHHASKKLTYIDEIMAR